MSHAFTPGPWRVIKSGPCGPACYSFWIGKDAQNPQWRGPSSVVNVANQVECHEIENDGRHKQICQGTGKQSEAEANARLISLAPDMLTMLEELHELLTDENADAFKASTTESKLANLINLIKGE